MEEQKIMLDSDPRAFRDFSRFMYMAALFARPITLTADAEGWQESITLGAYIPSYPDFCSWISQAAAGMAMQLDHLINAAEKRAEQLADIKDIADDLREIGRTIRDSGHNGTGEEKSGNFADGKTGPQIAPEGP